MFVVQFWRIAIAKLRKTAFAQQVWLIAIIITRLTYKPNSQQQTRPWHVDFPSGEGQRRVSLVKSNHRLCVYMATPLHRTALYDDNGDDVDGASAYTLDAQIVEYVH